MGPFVLPWLIWYIYTI